MRMASSYTYKLILTFLALTFFLLLGTIATKFEEKTKYRCFVVQGLLFTQLLSLFSAKYVWTYLALPGTTLVRVNIKDVLLAVMLIMAQFPIISGYILSDTEPHWFVLLTFICFGIMMMMFTLIVVWQILENFLALFRRQGPISFSVKVTFIFLLTVLLTTAALYNGNQPPQVKYFKIPIRNLPTSLKGLRILQLSDMHIGPTIGKSHVQYIVELANQQKPDLILLTGDLVDAPLQIKPAVEPLAKLTSKYGSFFVAGNHDFYTGYIDEWIEELKLLNITVLHNSYVPLSFNKSLSESSDKIYISGVFDHEGAMLRSSNYGQKLAAALNDRKPGIPTILMAHRPSAAKKAVTQFKDISLVVCGHTHGGQILPFAIWHYISEPYFSGLYKIDKSYVYVSNGVFHWGMPMRQFSRPDIGVFILE